MIVLSNRILRINHPFCIKEFADKPRGKPLVRLFTANVVRQTEGCSSPKNANGARSSETGACMMLNYGRGYFELKDSAASDPFSDAVAAKSSPPATMGDAVTALSRFTTHC